MASRRRVSVFQPPARFVSHKVLTLETKVIDRYMPDRLLLLLVNTLDRRVPSRVIDGVVNGLDRLPRRVRSGIITAADEYVPDTVANSRKASAVIAGIAKYIPDKVIPTESAQQWEDVKMKFHIPTLLSGRRRSLE